MTQSEREISKSELLVVTGLSGAGKSLVIQSLEDIGFFLCGQFAANIIAKICRAYGTRQPFIA